MVNERSGTGSAEIVIVGGGIVGCALAYDLAIRGVATQLIERHELAREASRASAGIISPPSSGFGSNAELALIAYRRYPELVNEVEELSGVSTGRMRSGLIRAATDSDVGDLEAVVSWQQENEIEASVLDQGELRQREPAIHGLFTGGVFTPDSFSLLLGAFAVALARAAVERGATLSEHTLVTGIERRDGRVTGVKTLNGTVPAGGVVIAAGAWSGVFSDVFDLPIPVMPVRGQMMAVTDPPVAVNSAIVYQGEYVLPRADGSIAIGATEEDDAEFDPRVTPAGIAWLSGVVDRIAPPLNRGRLIDYWAGLRPGSRDGQLIVGRVPHLENVWLATGHFRSGALLAPATSQLLADSIVNGVIDDRLTAFDPARFVAG